MKKFSKLFFIFIMLFWGGYAHSYESCAEFDNEMPKFLQFFNQKVGLFLHPKTNEDFNVVISSENFNRLESFAKLAKKVEFTRYSNSPCYVNQICELSSIGIWLEILVADFGMLNECVENNCSSGDATAIMLTLQSIYSDIEGELAACLSKNK